MSEENKIVELKDEDLEKVSGGFAQNEDGTYNILAGETFGHAVNGGGYYYTVLDDNYNVGLDTYIRVEEFWVGPDDMLIEFKVTTETVRGLLHRDGYMKLN